MMIYPDQQGLDMVFYDQKNNLVGLQEWEEGLALGMAQPKDDEEFQIQMQQLEKKLNQWVCDHLSRSERSPEIT